MRAELLTRAVTSLQYGSVDQHGVFDHYGAVDQEMGVLAPPSSFFLNVQCVRETEFLVKQQFPKGVFICDHAGLVINEFSRGHTRFQEGQMSEVPLQQVSEAPL